MDSRSSIRTTTYLGLLVPAFLYACSSSATLAPDASGATNDAGGHVATDSGHSHPHGDSGSVTEGDDSGSGEPPAEAGNPMGAEAGGAREGGGASDSGDAAEGGDAGPATADASEPAPDSGGVDSGGPTESPTPVGVPGNWSLVFDDEFSESTLDTSKWAPYWFADGDQSNNTTMKSTNVSVSGGNLNLDLTSAGTGGLVSTNPNGGVSPGFQFTYGYIEARINLPASGGSIANWPAWWADGQDWPTDGELDVMEGLGGSAAYHFHDPSGGPGSSVSGNYTGWHVFGANWVSESVTYYYDGANVGSITSGITSAPMYLILENSIGDSNVTVEPATMQVDYVRVWTQ